MKHIIFNDTQKQSEFDALCEYCKAVANRPYSAAKRSLMAQLNSLASGQYGRAVQREVVAILKGVAPTPAPQPTERPEQRLGKEQGGGHRQNQSPETSKPEPIAVQEAEAAHGGKLEAQEVVAGGEKESWDDYLVKEEEGQKHPGMVENLDQENDAEILIEKIKAGKEEVAALTAKEIIEQYGTEAIFGYLLSVGENGEELEEKSDRQLANLLKKRIG